MRIECGSCNEAYFPKNYEGKRINIARRNASAEVMPKIQKCPYCKYEARIDIPDHPKVEPETKEDLKRNNPDFAEDMNTLDEFQNLLGPRVRGKKRSGLK